jgi:hypothetical protein
MHNTRAQANFSEQNKRGNMAFNFSVDIWPGTDLVAALARAKQEAKWSSHNIVITGNTVSGSVRGEVEGSYYVREGEIHFTISKKPPFVSEGSLKDVVTNFF